MKQKYIRTSVLSFFLVLCLTVTIISGGVQVQAANFTDTSEHWASSAIDRWSGYGILNGYQDGKFQPNQPITRAEMAAVLDRVFCYQFGQGNVFIDVPGDSWYAEAINHLNTAGVMLGDGGNAYPNRNITREEAVVMIARAFGLAASEANISYLDADAISGWAIGLVRTMTAEGYVRGDKTGAFHPKNNLTRAEAVTILDNMIGALYTTSKTPYAGVWNGRKPYSGEWNGVCNGHLVVSASEGITLKNMTVNGDLIIMENVTGEVILENMAITGTIRNRSNTLVTERAAQSDGVFSYLGNTLPRFSNFPKNTLDGSQFFQEDGGAMRYNGLETRAGIDISQHQGTQIDWKQVKESGIDFAMIRLGFRGYGSSGSLNLDSCFKRNIAGALEAGVEVGVYFFSQATTMEEAVQEADYVVENLKGYHITYPVVFDWERYNSIPSSRTYNTDGQTVTNCANAFCKRVAEAGYAPMVYFNKYDGYLRYDLNVLAEYPIWYAQYSSSPDYLYQFRIWQYTDSGVVPGIPGPVDRNVQILY